MCLRLLTDRARSRAELADKLAAKGFTTEVAERALNRLAAVGLIDDAAFAEQWVHSRHTFSGKGKKVLAEELRRKGVAPEIAAPALEAITSDHERSRAADLVQQKLRTLPRDLDRDKATRRLVGMLARRGYEPSTAYTVVTAELATAGLPDPPRREGPGSGGGGLNRQRPESESRGGSDGLGAQELSHSPARDPVHPQGPGLRRGRVGPSGSVRDEEDAPGTAPAGSGRGKDCDEVAIALIRRKLRGIPAGRIRGLESRRLLDMLIRRGYTYSAASAALDAAVAAEYPGPPESGQDGDPFDKAATGAAGSAADECDHDGEPTRGADDLAVTLVRRKLRGMTGDLDRDKVIRRLVGVLARRGYPSSQAYAIVKAELAAAER